MFKNILVCPTRDPEREGCSRGRAGGLPGQVLFMALSQLTHTTGDVLSARDKLPRPGLLAKLLCPGCGSFRLSLNQGALRAFHEKALR
jgi:hypothetical protein